MDYFQQAIDRDPRYAAPYSGLADCYVLFGSSFDVGGLAPSEVQPKAKAAALRALELDSSLSDAHNSLAYVKLTYDWDWQGAEVEFKRSLELNPGYARGHHWYAHLLLSSGRGDEALAESNRALELDPVSPIINLHLGQTTCTPGSLTERSINWPKLWSSIRVMLWRIGTVAWHTSKRRCTQKLCAKWERQRISSPETSRCNPTCDAVCETA
jgi:tetratricopeptide (TPR) repeat protein